MSNERKEMPDREATEAAQKRAQEKGVDLDKVEGSGQGGKVTAQDVEKAEEKFLAFANPEMGSYSHTAYPDPENPSSSRTFYRNPHSHPEGASAQMVTEGEYAAFNQSIGGVPMLSRKGE